MAAIPFPAPPLEDDLVAMRPWEAADVPAKLAAFADPVFERFSDWAPRTDAAALDLLEEQRLARLRGDQLDLALVDPRARGTVLGGTSLYDVSVDERRAAVGYWLAPAARGRGVATHAVRLLGRWAFEHLVIARLELTCGPDNAASQRVAARCGFTREGLLRSHVPFKGGRRDVVVFGLLPDDLG